MKKILILGVLLLSAAAVSAQNLAEDIVKSGLKDVNFVNYVGPHKVIESRESIQGIGREIGRQMKANPTEAGSAKYKVVRVYDPKAGKLGADVFILGADASVDHIRNLNWIVAGYLQEAFGYSFDDALLLADFVTRYNAVYRGNLDYFAKNYIPGLGSQLTAESAGLALNYAEWPGKTRIVIPLRDTLTKGPGGLINAEEISNKAVTDKMKDEPGALDSRKKLTDLKEGEIVQEKKTIAAKEQEIAKKEEKLNQGAPAAPPATPPAAKPAAGTPAPTNPGATAPAAPAAAPPAAAPGQTPAAPAADAQKKQLADDKAAVEKAKAANDARDQQLQQDRKEIVQQEKKQEAAPAAPPVKTPPVTVPFLLVAKTGLGQMVLLDLAAKAVYKRSELNTIRKSAYQEFAGNYLAVAGENRGEAAVRLVLLKKEDLSLAATGKDDVSVEGPLLVSGTQALAVVKDSKGNWVLAAVDAKLQVTVKSDDAVAPNTALAVSGSSLLVQSASGKPLVLDAKTLKKTAETEN